MTIDHFFANGGNIFLEEVMGGGIISQKSTTPDIII